MVMSLYFFDLHLYSVARFVHAYKDAVAGLRFGIDDEFCQPVFQIALDRTFQGARSKLHVVSLLRHEPLCRIIDGQRVSQALDAAVQAFQLDIDDASERINVQLVESDDFIDAVDEFGGERLVERFRDYVARMLFVVGTGLRRKSDSFSF